MNNISFGAVKSPKDIRDYNYSNVKRVSATQLPSKFVLDVLPVRNQGGVGACVGFASTVIQEADGMTKKERESLSPLYLYAKCKSVDGSVNEGTTLRTAMQILSSVGVCKESIYPYKDNKDVIGLKFPTINSDSNSDASKRKIIGYSQVKLVQEVKEAVFNENGVLCGVLVTNSFKNPQNGCIGYLDGDIYGYHAIPIIGWDDNKEMSYKYTDGTIEKYKGFFIIKNSWGTAWGDNGMGYIPYDVFDIEAPDEAPYKLKLIEECWTTIHTPLGNGLDDVNYHKRFNNLVKPDPKPVPDPTPITNSKIVIEMQIDNPIAKVNGKSMRMTASPKLLNGATMTPFRNPFEFLGGKVSWNQTTKTATAEFNLKDIINKFEEIGK